MRGAARLLGLARSLALYYGTPWHAGAMRRLYGRFIAPGSLAFDIGAHAGNRVRCWRRLGARVVAVEPQRDFARLLELLFGRDDAVTCVRAAVGATPGAGTLYVSERTPTVSTLSQEWIDRVSTTDGFRRVRWQGTEDVDVTTLEHLISRFGRPDFIKVDVEGHERDVLAGLTTPVAALSFEYVPAAREIALACIDRLETLGDYGFNWSRGERHRFERATWQSAASTRGFIESLGPDDDSGDIYARLAT